MQYNNNDIDKNLRRLEDQAIPDLSQLDKHWGQASQSIQPMPTMSIQKISRWISAAIAAGVIVIFAYQMSTRSEGKKMQVTESIEKASIAHDTTKSKSHTRRFDTIGTSTLLTGRYDQAQEKFVFDTSKVPIVRPVGSTSSMVLVYHTPVHRKDTTEILRHGTNFHRDSFQIKSINSTNPANQILLADFFRQLEKPGQIFLINSKRDTVIHGAAGSSFIIPAYAFAGVGEVRITLKEFYSYADMICNKLTTLSNNELLESGGMIFIKAEMNNAEVKLQPGKIIRWFVPDTKQNMQSMKLFTKAESIRSMQGIDTVRSFSQVSTPNINWIQQEQSFQSNVNFNLSSEQNKTGNSNRTPANYPRIETILFRLKNSSLTKEQISDSIKSYYGITKFVINEIIKDTVTSYQIVISDFDQIRYVGNKGFFTSPSFYKLFPQAVIYQTSTIENASLGQFSESLLNQFSVLNNKYGVDLSTMGWINCDRFYNDRRIKVNYTVEFQENSESFVTFLVFDKSKTIMVGDNYQSKVIFRNVPEGEAVRVISVGIKEGQTITAMESVTLSNTTLKSLKFESATPASFRESIKVMDQQ